MAADRPGLAARERLHEVQRALSCVSSVVAAMVAESDDQYAITGTRPVELRVGTDTWLMTVRQWIRVEAVAHRTWEATTSGYAYELSRDDGTELLLYHWHPAGVSPVVSPHLHIGSELFAALRVARPPHLRTGMIEVPEIIVMLIREFEVRPVRRDWERVLSRLRASPA